MRGWGCCDCSSPPVQIRRCNNSADALYLSHQSALHETNHMHLCQNVNSRSVPDASKRSFARCRTPEAPSPLREVNETQRQGVPLYGSLFCTEMAGKRTPGKFHRTTDLVPGTALAASGEAGLDGECLRSSNLSALQCLLGCSRGRSTIRPTACSSRKRNCCASVVFGCTLHTIFPLYFKTKSDSHRVRVGYSCGHLPVTSSTAVPCFVRQPRGCDHASRTLYEKRPVACHRTHYLLEAFVC